MTDMIGNWPVNSVQNVDALTLLQGLPDGSVNCIVTSPPYLGLRSYTDGDDREVGQEATPAEYVAALVEIFREARRVLRSDGVFFLNLGDSYSSDSKWGGATGGKHAKGLHGKTGIHREKRISGMGDKQLLMIPARTAIALQDDGWILRSEIVWDKGNPMPESVKDRPTRAHEMIYLFAKTPHYFYDADAIKSPVQKQSIKRQGRAVSASHKNHPGAPGQTPHSIFRARKNNKQDGVGSRRYADFNERYEGNTTPMANARDVWHIHPKGFKGAHYATFPEELVERCLMAGCPVGGVVVDMFFGAGTTGLVAERLGFRWIGSDINSSYCQIAEHRIHGRLQEYQAKIDGQPYTLPLFTQESEG